MCGIAGISASQPGQTSEAVRKLLSGISHRGPDNSDFSFTADHRYCFAHTRLSIIDLSENGRQPMEDQTGDWIITYNGEIYNFKELRSLINRTRPNSEWRSNSDTEVLLALISLKGVHEAVSLLEGMFAFAAYQVSSKMLYLVRDRFGEKPLYYSTLNNQLVFSSDLKSLKYLFGDKLNPDPQTVKNFLKYGFVPGSQSIYEGIFTVNPGCWVQVDQNLNIEQKNYFVWGRQNRKKTGLTSEKEVIQNCEELISKAVKKSCTSDVPIGFFLSGGIDSSLICSLASQQFSEPIDTYTIAFEDSNYSEASIANIVAARLGANHRNYVIQPLDIMNAISEASQVWSEPFADPSQIPMLILSKFVAQDKKVVLSGDGGDELFCGYTRYTNGYDFFRLFKDLPDCIKSHCSSLPHKRWMQNLSIKFGMYERLLKASRVLACSTDQEYFDAVLAKSVSLTEAYLPDLKASKISDLVTLRPNSDFRKEMMRADSRIYLPCSVLTKVDRATMHYGLEARAPLLDVSLASYVDLVDSSLLYKRRRSKYILKEILKKFQGKEIFDRPKHGFNAPIADWLRGVLKPWAEDLLFEKSSYVSENFEEKKISEIWKKFQEGDEYRFNEVWVMLTFFSWLRYK